MRKRITLLLIACMLFMSLPVSATALLPVSSTGTLNAAISESVISYTASHAGVYKVGATADVTVTTELGSKADVSAGGEGYVYLLKGNNNITVDNANASLTFTKLPGNGMDYLDRVNIPNEPHIYNQDDAVYPGIHKTLAPGESFTFSYTPFKGLAGLIYPYILFSDGNQGNTVRISVDTGFYADLFPNGNTGLTWCWADAARKDIEILYVRNGENIVTIENLGTTNITMRDIKLHGTGNIIGMEWDSQLNVANLKPILLKESRFSDITIDADKATASVSFTQYGTMDDKIVNLVLAEYDITSGQLLNVNINPIDISLQAMDTTQEYSVSLPDITGNLKAMLLDENLTPYAGVAEAENPNLSFYAEIYVSPTGNDANSGSIDAPVATLKRANELVAGLTANMNDDILVHFAGGNYPVTTMMKMDQSVSGKNGYRVIYKGDDPNNPPVFNAGTKVSGWEKQTDSPIWVAPASDITATRTLYVNDNPATLARSRYLYQPGGLYNKTGSTYASDGFEISNTNFPKITTNPQDVMICWPILWTLSRTPVANITIDDSMTTFEMKQPQWATHTTMGYEHLKIGTGRQFYIENALELLDEPGEFYFDKTNKKMYYYPYEEEDMTKAEVYAGTTEKMLQVSGSSLTNKISNVEFNNLTFKYSALNAISKNGVKFNQTDHEWYCNTANAAGYVDRMFPAQITINRADSIIIKNCDFACLGSNGINMDNAVTNATIVGNTFRDISGTALVVGHFLHTNTLSSTQERVANVEVANNLIHRVANEYTGCAAVAIYYAKNVNMHHNDIKDVPYTGITVGWGWGADVAECRDIKVTHNRIENVTHKTEDGAHIYTLSRMENTHISNNYLINAGDYRGGIYLDQGSEAITMENNVVTDSITMIFARTQVDITGCVARNNYVDNENDGCDDSVCTEIGTVRVTDGNWPEAAKAIMREAGLQDSYKHLLDKNQQPEWRVLAYDRAPEVAFESTEIADVNRWIIAKEYDRFNEINYEVPSVYPGGEVGDTKPGEWLEFDIYVPETGTYTLSLRASDGNTSGATCTAKLDLDGTALETAFVIPRTGWSLVDYVVGEYTLTKGPHTFRITVQGLDWMIGGFQFDNGKSLPNSSDYDEGVIITQDTLLNRYGK